MLKAREAREKFLEYLQQQITNQALNGQIAYKYMGELPQRYLDMLDDYGYEHEEHYVNTPNGTPNNSYVVIKW